MVLEESQLYRDLMRLKPEGLWPSAAKRREMQIDAETAAIQSGAIAEQKT